MTKNGKRAIAIKIHDYANEFVCVRGLGFKFVDFLYKSSDVCHTEIKMISSENIFFCLSYKLLSIALLKIVSTQQ